MASAYPGGLDSFTNPVSTDLTNSVTVPHATQHSDLNDAVEAIQSELGIDPAGASATVVARLDLLAPKANPTFTGTVSVDSSIVFEGSTADAYETTVTVTDPTADRTITLPNLTGTVSLLDATETLTNKTLVAPALGAATATSLVASGPISGGLKGNLGAAPTVASATTIAPTTAVVLVSGTTTIETITAPAPIATLGGTITIIPTGVFVTGVTGNIALASTSVVSKALHMTYDPTTTKWYPSY